MLHDIIKDINSLTLIKISVLNKISLIIENCICDYILESIELDKDIVQIDLGFGYLYINISNDELTYKFIPNKKLEKKLLRAIENNQSPLVSELEKKLNQKIINTYKELL